MTACGGEPALNGIERDAPLDVAAVTLPDVTDPALRADGVVEDGRLRFVAADGHLLLVYFGFLNCPDVCPTTLADLRAALGRLDPDDAARVDLAFVTVDPDRDTPEALAAYLTHFVPRHHALRPAGPEAPELAAALEAFLASAEVTVDAAGEVEVAHSAVLYAVDPDGRVVIEWPFGTSSAAIASDLAVLLGRLDA